jgi:hypothetical protein
VNKPTNQELDQKHGRTKQNKTNQELNWEQKKTRGVAEPTHQKTLTQIRNLLDLA